VIKKSAEKSLAGRVMGDTKAVSPISALFDTDEGDTMLFAWYHPHRLLPKSPEGRYRVIPLPFGQGDEGDTMLFAWYHPHRLQKKD
jgi:hypothetical protein